LKHAAKLEADQDLRPENEHARLVECKLDLLGNLHVILSPQKPLTNPVWPIGANQLATQFVPD
jgi:hypothetical protein